MISGCERDYCVNAYCKKNPNFVEKSQSEALKDAMNMIKRFSEGTQSNFKNIICDPALQQNLCHSIQQYNLESCMNKEFLEKFSMSPYSLSISFMKEPSLLGKEDELGVNKFKLNLDEELVQKFYERLMQISIHESHMEERNPDDFLPNELFDQTA